MHVSRILLTAIAIVLVSLAPAMAFAQDAGGYQKLTEEAITLANAGNFQEAIVKAREANRVAIEFGGKDSWIAAVSAMNLGEMLRRSGQLEEAGALLRTGVEIGKTAEGSIPSVMASMKNTLAVITVQEGKYEEAHALYDEILADYERLGLSEGLEVAIVLNDMADLSSREGKYADAENQLKSAIKIFTDSLPPDNQDLASARMNLGMVYYNQQKMDLAETEFVASLEMLERTENASPLQIAQAKANLAFLRIGANDLVAAEPHLKDAIDTFEKNDPSYPGMSQLYEAYSMLLFQTDRFDEAKVYKDKAKK